MPSAVDIVNSALDEIRARARVTSISPSDGTPAGDLAARQYQSRIDALFRSALWNCARMQQSLGLLRAATGTPENPNGTLPQPPYPWAYEYAWPTNPLCLRPRYIVPLTPNNKSAVALTTAGSAMYPSYMGNNSQVPYLISSDADANGNQIRVILTNAQQAQLVYTARILDPNLWDASFVDAAIYTLAAWFAEPITGNASIAARCVAVAKELIMSARISDGNEGATEVNIMPDWLSIRAVGPANYSAYAVAANWDQISFPGGVVF